MAKKIDYYEDFLKTIEIRERINLEKSTKKIAISGIVLVAYIFLILITLSQTRAFSFLSFDSKSEIENLKTQINVTQDKVDSVLSAISSGKNISYQYLDQRISSIEEKNSYLYETILSSPDTAITPKILSEEQKNLDEKIQDLRSQTDKTNSILTGILITVLLAMAGHIVKQIWTTFVSKKETIKE